MNGFDCRNYDETYEENSSSNVNMYFVIGTEKPTLVSRHWSSDITQAGHVEFFYELHHVYFVMQQESTCSIRIELTYC